VSYIPCYIDYQKEAQPEIMTRNDPGGQEVFDYMEKITRSQKLTAGFAWEGDEILVNA